jgi:hypothetical protein
MTANYPYEVTKALENAKVKALFETIERQTPITFMPSMDDQWGASTQNGATKIEFAQTKAPVEALAHELLHTELKLGGFRQYTAMCALAPIERKSLYLDVLSMLDNELQHHRMFKRFSDLGLSGKRFYCDSDKNTYTYVRKNLQQMTTSNHAAEFLLQFVSIIALGGAGDEKQRKPLKNFLKTRCSTKTWQILMEAEREFAEWRNSSSVDASQSITTILRLLVGDDKLWFGPAGCQDLALGHFVGPEFTIEDACAYASR